MHVVWKTPVAVAALLAVGACATQSDQGSPVLRNAQIEQLTPNRFAVSITALNMDGYMLARCIAGAYVNQQRDDQDNLIYSHYVRDGGKLTDEFRKKDGVREQTTSGLQIYTYAKEGSHDGRDVMGVEEQLVVCEKLGLPTKVEAR